MMGSVLTAALRSIAACVAALFLVANAWAQSKGPSAKDPSLMLSAGLLMFTIERPDQKVSLAEHDTLANTIVVPAGQFLLVFKDKMLGNLNKRYLAITEQGI